MENSTGTILHDNITGEIRLPTDYTDGHSQLNDSLKSLTIGIYSIPVIIIFAIILYKFTQISLSRFDNICCYKSSCTCTTTTTRFDTLMMVMMIYKFKKEWNVCNYKHSWLVYALLWEVVALLRSISDVGLVPWLSLLQNEFLKFDTRWSQTTNILQNGAFQRVQFEGPRQQLDSLDLLTFLDKLRN